MLDSREWPRRRNEKSADVVFGSQLSKHFRKTQIIADAEAETQIAKPNAREPISRRKAGLLCNGRDRIQMRLAIFGDDVAFRINKNLGIVD